MFRNFHRKRWVGILLVLLGPGLLIGGVWMGHDAWVFLESSARAPGTIIALRRERGARGMPSDHPIVRYTVPATGRTVTFRTKVGMWPSPFSVGERVVVAYPPNDPERADIVSFWTVWMPPVGMLLLGVMSIAAGTITISNLRSRKAASGT